MAIKIEYCLSCGSKDIKVTGNKFYCPDCDITYKVTAQGTKVIETDPLGKEKARIDQIEKDIAHLKGEKEPGPEPTKPAAGDEDDVDKNEDEDENEQDGFLTWQ